MSPRLRLVLSPRLRRPRADAAPSFLLGAVLACTGAGAFAQAAPDAATGSVEVYGIIDGGIRHVSQANAAGALTQFVSGLNTSRFGLRGSESLGDDLRATFRLLSGFNAGTGAQSNAALFDRTAAVGLGGRRWDLQLGRQEGFGYEDAAAGRTDPLQMALNYPNYASPAAAGSKAPVLGADPLQGLYTYTYGQLRYDNALRLSTGGANWSGGLFYALGGVAGSFGADAARGARLDGHLGPVGAEVLWQQSEDLNGSKSTLDVIAATWELDAWKFQAGLHQLNIDAGFNSAGLGNGGSSSGIQGNSTSVSTVLAGAKQGFHESIADLAATWQATVAVPVTLAVYRTHTDGTAPGSSLALVGLGKYYLSRRTALYLELDHARQGGQLAVKTVNTLPEFTGYMFGLNHRF